MLKLLWEWWLQIWPNLAASAITASVVYLWAHRKFVAELERRERVHRKRHEELRDLIKEQGGKL